MSDFGQGLTVSILGLLFTFVALGLFILVMVALQRLFPARPEIDEIETEREFPLHVSLREPSEEEEVAAAIAVAIAHFQSMQRSKLGESLEKGRGSWWAVNRVSAVQSNLQKK